MQLTLPLCHSATLPLSFPRAESGNATPQDASWRSVGLHFRRRGAVRPSGVHADRRLGFLFASMGGEEEVGVHLWTSSNKQRRGRGHGRLILSHGVSTSVQGLAADSLDIWSGFVVPVPSSPHFYYQLPLSKSK